MNGISTGTRMVFLLIGLGVLTAAAPQSAPEPYARAWATFIGGNNFERAQGCTVDAQGFIYVVGNTSSTNLPTTPGAFQGAFNGGGGGGDGYVAKLAPDGRSLVWCTYLGGSAEDRTYGVQVDAQGFVYVTTWTASANFPVTAGAYDTTQNGGMDVAYTKMRADGSGIVWSTFVGGSGGEQARGSIFINSAGEVYSSGWTDSPNFPTTTGAYQRTLRGAGDAFVFKLSSNGSQLLYSTLFGGSHATFVDTAYTRVTVHTDATVYISGITRSTDLPVTSTAYQRTYGGDAGALGWHGDAFVARFNATLSGLVYSTYLGGSSGDEASVNNGLTVDSAGRAIVLGNTTSTNFPTTAGAYQRTQRGGQLGDGFVAILSTDGSQLVASTLIGGTDSEETSGISIDSAGNVYFSGNTQSADYPVTSNALQSTYRGGASNTDAWFTKLSSNLSTVLYSTYLGGSGTSGGFGDRGRCLVLDSSGNVIVTGDANSTDFPVSAGAYDTTHNGGVDSFVVKFTLGAMLPTVTIAATDASASEPGTNTGTFTITRSGSTTGALAVTLNVSGTAVNGTDYASLSGTVTVPAGQASALVTVSVLNDSAVEGNETVVATVAGTSFYTVGTPGSATITIADDDVPPPSAPSGLSATAVSSSQINLAWTDNSGNETGFKMERKTGAGGTYSQIATVGANVTTFSNAGLSAATQYFYRVRATGAGGDSGYSNEASATTSAAGPDSDSDGLPDAWEQQHFGNLAQSGSGDPDGDGLTNAQELAAGTNPTLSDTDGDGLTDGAEMETHNTDPLAADSDGDGMGDGAEVTFGFDPLNSDQDSNSQVDGLDDWDGDGIINQLDPTPGSVPVPVPPPSGDDDHRCGATGIEAVLLAWLALRRRNSPQRDYFLSTGTLVVGIGAWISLRHAWSRAWRSFTRSGCWAARLRASPRSSFRL